MSSSTDNLETIVDAYLDRHKRPNTRRSYAYTLATLTQVLGGDTPLALITEDDIDRHDDYLHDRGLAAATIASWKKRVKAFFNWCVEREMLDAGFSREVVP